MNAHSVPLNATLRVARPTDDVDSLLRFYRDGLGLNELGRFTDHDGILDDQSTSNRRLVIDRSKTKAYRSPQD